MIGVALALARGALCLHFVSGFALDLTMMSIGMAFACSTAIGVAVGFLPARSASKLDPVEALARE